MDTAATVASLISIARACYASFDELKELPTRFRYACNTLLILEARATTLSKSRRLPDRTLITLQEATGLVTKLKGKLDKYSSWHRRVWCWATQDGRRTLDRISDIASRLELLADLNTDLVEGARFDAANIIEDDESVQFWDKFFGSETMYVSLETFVRALSTHLQRRLRSQERYILESVLDPDVTNDVSVYHFASWVAHFGLSLDTLVGSLMNNHTGRLHEWWKHDAFENQARASLNLYQPVAVRYGETSTSFHVLHAHYELTVVFVQGSGFEVQGDTELTRGMAIKNSGSLVFFNLSNIVEASMVVWRLVHDTEPDSPHGSVASDSSTSSSSSSSTAQQVVRHVRKRRKKPARARSTVSLGDLIHPGMRRLLVDAFRRAQLSVVPEQGNVTVTEDEEGSIIVQCGNTTTVLHKPVSPEHLVRETQKLLSSSQ